MDYGKSLNLPLPDFPMRGNLPQAEPKMQQWWEEIDIYAKVREHRNGKPKFILHDGPPFANGDIHIGHALNKLLKDFIIRYKTMKGFDAPYVPGWDTHGLPIEQAITNNGKVDRKKMSVLDFRIACAEYALNWVDKQRLGFKRLGISADWDNPYMTLQPQYEAQQIRVFGEMFKKGSIYKGLKPVYWSPSSESALAEAEIEYKEKTSASIYVAFDVKDGKGILPNDAAIVIWTTTPWTLPANLGISVHPEYDYALVEVNNHKYVLAEGMLEEAAKQIGWDEYNILNTWKGAALEFVVCQHPFYERDSLVMVGDHVTLEAGTGCVHTAPGHGEEDFIIGQRYQIGVLCPVDDQGKFTNEAPGFEGIFYDKANAMITEMLKESGKLLHMSFIQHQYMHDWRTKKPVIYRATEQWFASVDKFRQQMLDQIKQVKWTPAWGETRLHNMIADRGDWCISRQRAWGVPIPIFYCRACSTPLATEASIGHVADLIEQEGSNIWFAREAEQLIPAEAVCSSCGSNDFRKETDIMDVWFDSGSSHMAVLEARPELSFPADLYLEGSDQYRGWYNSSLITSVTVRGESPYRGILSHGFTLDGEGRKMSKSIGNTVDPLKVCGSLGADILRLWVASVDYQEDVRISDNILTQTTEVYRKIRNTLRFLLGNLSDFNHEQDSVAYEAMNELDKYAMTRLHRMIERVTNAYEKYEFHVVYQAVHHFCAVEMSAFYLDIVKDRLYASRSNDPARRASQTVLYEALSAITRIIAPILPHTADEVWRFIPDTPGISVQLAELPQANTSVFNIENEQLWSQFIELREDVFKALEQARQDKLIGNSLSACVHVYPNEAAYKLLQSFEPLDTLFIVSQVKMYTPDTAAPDSAMMFKQCAVHITVADGEKCDRCWIVTTDIGHNAEHPTICKRCSEVISN